MKTKYVQEFARNYSLFQVVGYTEFMKRSSPEYGIAFDTGRPLFVFEPEKGPLVKIYYHEGGLKEIFSRVGQVVADIKYFNGVTSKFLKVIKEIKPYFEKRKSVQNIDELKKLYDLYQDFAYGEAVVWVAPLVENLPEVLKAEALSVRKETEILTSMRDEVLDYNLSQLFPGLGELVHFISIESVFGGKSSDELKNEAKKYQKGFVFFDKRFYIGDKEKVLNDLNIEIVDREPEKDIGSFKGQIASKGIVKGEVKLVFLTKDTGKVTESDILVSPMTRPDFLPAMKRAAAYVTDEGGITCHAAIVARELKKPCIIGTKIATRVLKDGDLVEVDASKGIVKILKKK